MQGAKKCPPEHPCGAKPRGGGGAPPTNLILLRNQRPHVRVRRGPGERHGQGYGQPRHTSAGGFAT